MSDSNRRGGNPITNIARAVVRLITLPFRIIGRIFTGGGRARKPRR